MPRVATVPLLSELRLDAEGLGSATSVVVTLPPCSINIGIDIATRRRLEVNAGRIQSPDDGCPNRRDDKSTLPSSFYVSVQVEELSG